MPHPRTFTAIRSLMASSSLALLAAFSPHSMGQEARVQVLGFAGEEFSEASQEGAAAPIAGIAIAAADGAFSLGGMPLGAGPGGMDPNDRSQLFNLLSNTSVRAELQLTEEQIAGVRQIIQASQQRLSEHVREAMAARRNSGGGAIRLELQDMMRDNREQAEAAIEEILLPEQLNRVRQLAYQVEISREGLGEALVSGRLGNEIGVHDDQKQHLLDRAIKIEAEARQAIIAIQAQARDKLLSELTPEQRKAAEDLLGPYFQYEEPSLGQQLHQAFKQRSSGDSQDSPEKDR
ncbi:MAG: hypothetical protein NXI32_23225 [bacterium]|nr:hypothetical protein [bacterium]